MRRYLKLENKLWDVDTVTPADFTVVYTITDKIWKKFLETPEAKETEYKLLAFSNFL
jgi:uncharacterized membrane protein